MAEHVKNVRALPGYTNSPVIIYVERNLGFEAEHHRRALQCIPNVSFYMDQQHNRLGILTTNPIKHAMAQLVTVMLEEKRIHVRDPLVSRDPRGNRIRLREQMEVYSYQYKMADTTFQQDRVALSGKVGGMKDDICIALQFACYFTQVESQRKAVNRNRHIQ